MKKSLILILSLFSCLVFSQELKLKTCETTPEIIPFLKRDKFGYCDKNGVVLIEPKFNYAETFSFEFELHISENAKEFATREYATVELSGKKYRIDKTGNIVLNYDDVEFNPSDCCSEVIRENKIITTEEKGKKTYSVVNNGVVVIKPNSYDLIKYIYLIEKNSDYFLVEKNNKFGVINKQNEILIPIQFSSLQNMNYSVQFEDGILFIGQRNNKKVIIDLCKNEYIIK